MVKAQFNARLTMKLVRKFVGFFHCKHVLVPGQTHCARCNTQILHGRA